MANMLWVKYVCVLLAEVSQIAPAICVVYFITKVGAVYGCYAVQFKRVYEWATPPFSSGTAMLCWPRECQPSHVLQTSTLMCLLQLRSLGTVLFIDWLSWFIQVKVVIPIYSICIHMNLHAERPNRFYNNNNNNNNNIINEHIPEYRYTTNM